MPAHKGNLHSIALLQPAPLKCVPTLARLYTLCLRARAICTLLLCFSQPFEVCPETAAHKPYNCSSRSYSRFPSVYHWLWARLDCCCHVGRYNYHLKRSAGKIQSVCERQPFSTRATRYAWCGQVQINVVPAPWPGGQNWRTNVRYTIAPSTIQPVNVEIMTEAMLGNRQGRG